jgi:hypothetical protein
MQVSGRAALRSERVLDNKESVAILRGHLELDGANAQSPMLTESVLTGRNPQNGRNIGLSL